MSTPRDNTPDSDPNRGPHSRMEGRPDAQPNPQIDSRIAAERRLLSALCQNSIDEPTRHAVVDRLQNRTFAAPEHEIIFLAWTKLSAIHTEPTRETVTVSITRLGFPDVDIDSLFSVVPPSADELPALLRQL